MNIRPSILGRNPATAEHFASLMEKAPGPLEDARAATIRQSAKLACPKCWSAEHLSVSAECNCKIDERGRAWPHGTFDGSYSSDSRCSCECGWNGDVAQAEDAFSECCTSCAAEPGHLRRNATDDGRECTQCSGEDV